MLAANNAQPRLFESDLTPMTPTISFNGKEYKIHLQITAYGDITTQATDWVCLLTSKNAPGPAIDHYRKIVARSSDLEHHSMQLRDHIQVFQCILNPVDPPSTLSRPPVDPQSTPPHYSNKLCCFDRNWKILLIS